MIREQRKEYLLESNEKLIDYLNKVIGNGKEKIMSQRELAQLLNCSNSTVSRWLRYESPLSIDIAIKICDILNLDKSQYLGNILLIDDDVLKLRFLNLSEKNKMKVIEYIDFLLYQESISKSENDLVL